MQADRAYSKPATELNLRVRKAKLTKKSAPYLFISPYFIFYGIFGLFPIIFSLYISFTNWNGFGEMNFVGLKNYLYLFDPSSYFFKSVGNTIFFVGLSLPLQIALGLLIASLLYSQFTKWK